MAFNSAANPDNSTRELIRKTQNFVIPKGTLVAKIAEGLGFTPSHEEPSQSLATAPAPASS